MNRVNFKKTNNEFFCELKEKVDDYFLSNKLKRSGNYKIFIKSIIFFLIATLSYLMPLFFVFPLWILAIFYILLGISFAGIGFNILHDGGHGSYCSKNWVNELMGYSLNLIGGNIFIWKNKHNLNHHNYTNVEGIDDDIDIEPWIRTNINQPKRWYHRYQHIYALGLYGLTYMNWVFLGDFKKYFSKKIGTTDLSKMDVKEHLIFWLSKIIFFSLFLVIPIVKIGLWKAIVGYLIMSFVCGFILGVIFQLAHLIEEAEFPLPSKNTNQIEQNWVLHQIATTVNFATKNKFLFWFSGGLNFQAVHHIFPKISHIHYPEINERIRETCRKFNIKYIEFPSFWSALNSHISYLKWVGLHDIAVPIPKGELDQNKC